MFRTTKQLARLIPGYLRRNCGNHPQIKNLAEKQIQSLSSEELNMIEKCLPSSKSTDLKKCLPNLRSEDPSLLNLSSVELKVLGKKLETFGKKCKSMAKCMTYFQDGDTMAVFREDSIYPSNASALVAGGTIQILDVQEGEDALFFYEQGYAEKIKMKVKGSTSLLSPLHKINSSPDWRTEVRLCLGVLWYQS